MSLAAHGSTSVGSFCLEVDLDADEGETVAVVGPNGAGKTTLLRVLAGLHRLRAGSVHLGPEALDDPGGGSFVSPEHRSVGVVFQDRLLLPQLGAVDNVAFGLRARGLRRSEARRQAGDWLRRVGLAPSRHGARPPDLSGGEAQRVALARALAVEPALLLLDEPLAALDVQARGDLRRDLRRHLAATDGVRVLVTHDPLDALALADRVVVMEGGRVTQAGTPADIAAHPRSTYAGRFVGTNAYRARAHGGRLELAGGGRLTSATSAGGDVLVVVNPTAIALHRARPAGTPRNVWAATVEAVEPAGDRVRVRLGGPLVIVAEVTPAAVRELGLAPGDQIWASVKATEVDVSPA